MQLPFIFIHLFNINNIFAIAALWVFVYSASFFLSMGESKVAGVFSLSMYVRLSRKHTQNTLRFQQFPCALAFFSSPICNKIFFSLALSSWKCLNQRYTKQPLVTFTNKISVNAEASLKCAT